MEQELFILSQRKDMGTKMQINLVVILKSLCNNLQRLLFFTGTEFD